MFTECIQWERKKNQNPTTTQKYIYNTKFRPKLKTYQVFGEALCAASTAVISTAKNIVLLL